MHLQQLKEVWEKKWAEIMKSGSKLTSNDNFSNSVHQKMDDLLRAL